MQVIFVLDLPSVCLLKTVFHFHIFECLIIESEIMIGNMKMIIY